jgi:hypothetical protein
MVQDAIDHAGIGNKGNEAPAAAARAQQGIRLENLLNQPAHVLRVSLEPSNPLALFRRRQDRFRFSIPQY